VETDASDYALTAILSIVNEENEVHLVAFTPALSLWQD